MKRVFTQDQWHDEFGKIFPTVGLFVNLRNGRTMQVTNITEHGIVLED